MMTIRAHLLTEVQAILIAQAGERAWREIEGLSLELEMADENCPGRPVDALASILQRIDSGEIAKDYGADAATKMAAWFAAQGVKL